jgi:purine-binding chemotaxis protein CheW
MSEPSAVASTRSVCTFLVSGLCLGIEVSTMREVLRAQTLTRVPRAPREVRGLMNLRGQIVTAVDLAERLRLPRANRPAAAMNVIVQTKDGPVSLLVDEIGDVVEVGAAEAEPPPANLRPEVRELILQVYKLRDGLLLLLDVDKTVISEG